LSLPYPSGIAHEVRKNIKHGGGVRALSGSLCVALKSKRCCENFGLDP
jgi:hypothetical protein